MSKKLSVGFAFFTLLIATLFLLRPRPELPAVSPMNRLETESPILSDAVKIVELKLQGDDATKPNPKCQVAPASHISLAGKIISGRTKLSTVITTWKPREGEEQTVRSEGFIPGQPFKFFMLHIHGEDDSKNGGVLTTEMVEVRPGKILNESGYEIRADFVAPKRPGQYVIDLQFLDKGSVDPEDAEYKPAGFPFWRCQLTVN